jgi:hypothetical protein
MVSSIKYESHAALPEPGGLVERCYCVLHELVDVADVFLLEQGCQPLMIRVLLFHLNVLTATVRRSVLLRLGH